MFRLEVSMENTQKLTTVFLIFPIKEDSVEVKKTLYKICTTESKL